MTGKYSVSLKRSAEKELRTLPKKDLSKVLEKIKSLVDQPRPHGCEKLSGKECYRFRQGDYRVVYTIDDTGQAVVIYKVGHRREIYRS